MRSFAAPRLRMTFRGRCVHALKGQLKGNWADGNTRLTFAFQGIDAIIVNYQDYH